MNKEIKKIVSLLGQGTFLDNVFNFDNKNINAQDVETNFESQEYLYHTVGHHQNKNKEFLTLPLS